MVFRLCAPLQLLKHFVNLRVSREQGTDVIYNEATFPALLSTLSNDHLCSDSTVIYLATKLVSFSHRGHSIAVASNILGSALPCECRHWPYTFGRESYPTLGALLMSELGNAACSAIMNIFGKGPVCSSAVNIPMCVSRAWGCNIANPVGPYVSNKLAYTWHERLPPARSMSLATFGLIATQDAV